MSQHALNGPVEMSVRTLAILAAYFPAELDLSTLTLLDHGLLHSADLAGPPSLSPAWPIREGELGVKRERLRQGLLLLTRAGLVEVLFTDTGLRWRAAESGPGFLALLSAPYAAELQTRAQWLVERFGDLSESELRSEMRNVSRGWLQEFEPTSQGTLRD